MMMTTDELSQGKNEMCKKLNHRKSKSTEICNNHVGSITHLIFWRASEEIYESGLHILCKSRCKNILFWAKLVPRLPNY
jgi:hypothetical protein